MPLNIHYYIRIIDYLLKVLLAVFPVTTLQRGNAYFETLCVPGARRSARRLNIRSNAEHWNEVDANGYIKGLGGDPGVIF